MPNQPNTLYLILLSDPRYKLGIFQQQRKLSIALHVHYLHIVLLDGLVLLHDHALHVVGLLQDLPQSRVVLLHHTRRALGIDKRYCWGLEQYFVPSKLLIFSVNPNHGTLHHHKLFTNPGTVIHKIFSYPGTLNHHKLFTYPETAIQKKKNLSRDLHHHKLFTYPGSLIH